jgi:hypothetical protein
MNVRILQTVIPLLIALFFLAVVYRLGRKRRISFRYTVGWLILGLGGAITAFLLPHLQPIAEFFKVSPSAVLIAGTAVFLVFICLQLSVSISGMQEQLRTLVEKLGELEYRIEEIDDHTNT